MSNPSSTWTFLPDPSVLSSDLSRPNAFVPGIDLLLDDDGDLVVDRDVYFSRGLEAVAQGIRIRLQMFRGEWFLDLDAGVPYYQELLGQKFSEVRARAAFRAAILAAPGATELISLAVTFNRSTRRMSVDWEVRTDYGVTTDRLEV